MKSQRRLSLVALRDLFHSCVLLAGLDRKGIEPYGWNRLRNFFQPKAECYLSQKISEVIGPEAREILIQAITNGSVVSWQHINLLGEYDFSDEKLQDSAGIKPPN